MRQARQNQFDPSDPPWLHCISRCVRRAFLCGEGLEHRKAWLERRLRILSRCFAVSVGGYAIMSNHVHVVVRPRPDELAQWSAEAVARAWWYQREDADPQESEPEAWREPPAELLERLTKDEAFIACWRERLSSVSWFMKALKEPLSRMANREDGCTGAFWEGRFTSVPLLDQAAIVACMVYVDLNPIRAQLAEAPEMSAHTSVKTRIEQRWARANAAQLRREGERAAAHAQLRSAQLAATAASETSATQRRDPSNELAYRSWLTPVCEWSSTQAGDPGWSLDAYLRLVEASGSMTRGDKRGVIPADLPSLLARLDANIDVESWRASICCSGGLRGRALGTMASLATEAVRRGCQWLQRRCPLFQVQGKASVAS